MAQLVEQRVEEELARRKDEIEAEVLRRIAEARRAMEQAMLAELEAKRQAELEVQRAREVNQPSALLPVLVLTLLLSAGVSLSSNGVRLEIAANMTVLDVGIGDDCDGMMEFGKNCASEAMLEE